MTLNSMMMIRTLRLLLLIFALSGGSGGLFAADAFAVQDGVDHARLLGNLDRVAFERGQRIYRNLCVNCHGADGLSLIHISEPTRPY